jgi:predicted ArsR family transcriptional regulator
METYVIKRLEQAKLLTDPFKLKLLEGFAIKPATTKQVADRMGEKAPRLYRHVDALVDEGLLELVEEKPKRGTIERYYKTIADRFEVDPGLFSPDRDGDDSAIELLREVIRDVESDVVKWFDRHADREPTRDELPLLMRYNVRGSPEDIARLREKIESFLEDCNAVDEDREDDPGFLSYSGFIAFYERPESN